ncbi:MAG: hypothetical protein ACRCYE_04855 [Sarcina sp.]
MKFLWNKIKNNIGHYGKNLGGNGFFDLSKMEKKSERINKKQQKQVKQLAKVIQFPR